MNKPKSPVAKYAKEFNRCQKHRDKKREAKQGIVKHVKKDPSGSFLFISYQL